MLLPRKTIKLEKVLTRSTLAREGWYQFIFMRYRGDSTEISCKLDRWYRHNPFSCLSICLFISRFVVPAAPCRTNNNESNEAKSRSDATCARSRREISAACRKMQDEISLPAAFLGRKIPLGKLRSLSPHAHRERLFLPSHFPTPPIVYRVYVVSYRTCHTLPRTLSRSFKQMYKSRKLHAWLLSFPLLHSLYSYRIQFAREIVPLIRQHGNKCNDREKFKGDIRYFSDNK